MSLDPVEMMGSGRVLPLITMSETMMILTMVTLYVSMSLDPVEMMGSGRVLPHSLASRGDLCQ
jgi:hypothetical protein